MARELQRFRTTTRSHQAPAYPATGTPHILIFEPEANGHQMEYIRHLLTSMAFSLPGLRVTLLTTAEAERHVNTARLLHAFPGILSTRLAPTISRTNPLFRRLGVFQERQWRQCEMLAQGLRALATDRPSFVVVPHLEAIGLINVALRPNLFGGLPWATISIATRFHHRQCGIEGPRRAVATAQRALFAHVIRRPSLACFGTINPYFAPFARHAKVAYTPEPCAPPVLTSRDQARAAYGIRKDTCVITVFGFLDRRKCIAALLEGAARVPPEVDLTVFLAGPQHPGNFRPILANPSARALQQAGRLIEANRFILNDVDPDPLAAADIAWVFYEPDFVNSSSVLLRSALARRPVVARRCGVVGRQVEQHGMGLALPDDDPATIAAALTRLAQDPALRDAMGYRGFEAFSRTKPADFAKPIVDAIERATQPPATASYPATRPPANA